MATQSQRKTKQVQRAHHNATNRTSVPHECIAKSRRLTIFDLEQMKVKDLRAYAAGRITGFSKASRQELIAKLALFEIRKENDASTV